MAFILPAWDGQKRVKYIGPDGSQLPQEDRSWHWLQADLTRKFAQVPQRLLPPASLRQSDSSSTFDRMHAHWHWMCAGI